MKFNKKLVLNSYLLSLFGVVTFDELSNFLKNPNFEQLDDNNNSIFYHELCNQLTSKKISNDKLLEYDENIVKHTKAIDRDINWKYFQYLSLLFVEIYLDKYFENKEKLLSDLNQHLDEFNLELIEKEKFPPYTNDDLNKLALYNATGSGKTLLMHINFKQFMHYADIKKYNQKLLITPNEGLSNQHLEEFKLSKIKAETFNKTHNGFFNSKSIKIIEITKLVEGNGEKTVAVDSFEDNNLVFIDEGHRGASGEVWKTNRDKLSKNGFAFEYSATFAQAISSNTGKKKTTLENEYCKSILFDYSYKYFYKDGYGKDYSILNLSEDIEDLKQTYLTATLLAFYQQLKIYENSKQKLAPYLIEKPLMVFVGSSVNKVSKKEVSDVVDILLFLNNFIKNKSETITNIERVLSLDSGLQNKKGIDIFDKKFNFLNGLSLSPSNIFDDVLAIVFNSCGGLLHIENLKGIDGEIGLKVGESEYFGIINVGDSDKLTKLCEANDLIVNTKSFSYSLFKDINEENSKLQILVGSKKFSEGWSSWRVSTMGLMNVGKKEGSQIIQLFGRGVRLKGYDFCLKRSKEIPGKELEKKYSSIETLNVFGLKADYMKVFKDHLSEEGMPTEDPIEFVIPLIYDNHYKSKKLKVLDLQDGKSFKKEVVLNLSFESLNQITKKVNLNLYKQLDILESQKQNSSKLDLNTETLTESHLSFVNIDNVYFALQQFKNEKHWSNLSISKEFVIDILKKKDWYKLEIPKKEMEITSFKQLRKMEKLVTSLLKKYMKSFYEYKKSKWESQFLEYRDRDG
jgi:hypothetical protein